jgi:hypothetical protein
LVFFVEWDLVEFRLLFPRKHYVKKLTCNSRTIYHPINCSVNKPLYLFFIWLY